MCFLLNRYQQLHSAIENTSGLRDTTESLKSSQSPHPLYI